jgi:hypothetical protein
VVNSDFAVRKLNLERLSKDILVTVLGRRRPVVGALIQVSMSDGLISSATRSPNASTINFILPLKFRTSLRS